MATTIMTPATNTTTPILDTLSRNYRSLQAGIVVVLFVIFGYFLLWPEYQNIRKDGVLELRNVETTLQQRQQYLLDLKTMEQNYQTLDRTVFAIMRDVLPEQDLPTDAFPEIEQAFASADFSIQNINVTPVAPTTATNSEVQILSISVNATANQASYENFKTLLANLEQQRRLLDIQSISYSSESTSFTFVLNTYAIAK